MTDHLDYQALDPKQRVTLVLQLVGQGLSLESEKVKAACPSDQRGAFDSIRSGLLQYLWRMAFLAEHENRLLLEYASMAAIKLLDGDPPETMGLCGTLIARQIGRLALLGAFLGSVAETFGVEMDDLNFVIRAILNDPDATWSGLFDGPIEGKVMLVKIQKLTGQEYAIDPGDEYSRFVTTVLAVSL